MEQMMAKPVFETITERPCLSPKSWLFRAELVLCEDVGYVVGGKKEGWR